jgi:hypothetical protein
MCMQRSAEVNGTECCIVIVLGCSHLQVAEWVGISMFSSIACTAAFCREDWALVYLSEASAPTSLSLTTSTAERHAGASSSPAQPDMAQAKQLWRDVASAAESGWDFSTRWLLPSGSAPSSAAGVEANGGQQQPSGDSAGRGGSGGEAAGTAGGRRADLRELRTTQVEWLYTSAYCGLGDTTRFRDHPPALLYNDAECYNKLLYLAGHPC